MTTWVLTGSPENHAATRAHGYGVIGLKERNRARAEHWRLVLRGQIRPVSDHDGAVLPARLRAAAPVAS